MKKQRSIPRIEGDAEGLGNTVLQLFFYFYSWCYIFNFSVESTYFYISTFRSMCSLPNMVVLCSSLTSCFPGMLLTYFLNVFEIVPVAPIITGITFVLHSKLTVFLLQGLYILKSSRLLF